MTAPQTIKAKAVWQNGKLVPFGEALTHVSAFGMHYGLGVFEGVRGYRRHKRADAAADEQNDGQDPLRHSPLLRALQSALQANIRQPRAVLRSD